MNRLFQYFLIAWLIGYPLLILVYICSFYFAPNVVLLGVPYVIIMWNFAIPLFLYQIFRKSFFQEKIITEEERKKIGQINEVTLWMGRKSQGFIEKKVFTLFILLWYSGLTFIFVFRTIELGNPAVEAIHTLISILIIAFCLLLFIFWSFKKIRGAGEIYGITEKRIFYKSYNKAKELLIDPNILFRITKSYWMASLVGTVSFYQAPFKKPKLKFEYIQDINRLEAVLKGLLSLKQENAS